MIREILTLIVDNISTQYYINFEKERTVFNFQPTLKNKSAPVFMVIVNGDELQIPEAIDGDLANQAKEKVKEILDNMIFDQY